MWVQLISGGLGNQLFMLTAAAHFTSHLSLKGQLIVAETKSNQRVHSLDSIDLHAFLGPTTSSLSFRPLRLTDRIRFRFDKVRPLCRVEEMGYVAGLPCDQQKVVFGYFQSFEYMREVRKLGATFEILPRYPSPSFEQNYEKFNRPDLSWIHIRRGDYNRHQSTIGVLGREYFVTAVEQAIEEGRRNFIVASDDKAACEPILRSLPRAAEYTFVDRLGVFSDVETLSLASKGGAVVCSNSSFSWWASMGGREDKLIFAPEPWFVGLPEPLRLFSPSAATRLQADFS